MMYLKVTENVSQYVLNIVMVYSLAYSASNSRLWTHLHVNGQLKSRIYLFLDILF